MAKTPIAEWNSSKHERKIGGIYFIHEIHLNRYVSAFNHWWRKKKRWISTHISISLNVVSIENVFCESFNRVATRFLSLVMGTYSEKVWKHLIEKFVTTTAESKIKVTVHFIQKWIDHHKTHSSFSFLWWKLRFWRFRRWWRSSGCLWWKQCFFLSFDRGSFSFSRSFSYTLFFCWRWGLRSGLFLWGRSSLWYTFTWFWNNSNFGTRFHSFTFLGYKLLAIKYKTKDGGQNSSTSIDYCEQMRKKL